MIIEKKRYLSHSLFLSFFYPVIFSLKVVLRVIFPFIKWQRKKTNYIDNNYSLHLKKNPILLKDQNQMLRCTSCNLCSLVCPTSCIDIDLGDNVNLTEGKPPKSFKIKMNQCLFCLYCVDVCPVDAINFASNDNSAIDERGISHLI